MKNSVLTIASVSIIALLLCTFTSLTGFKPVTTTGEIKGIVTDKKTGDPLPFVNLLLIDSTNKTISQAATDVNGAFLFRNITPGIYQCEISYAGYEKSRMKEIKVSGGKMTNLPIALTVASTQLQAVTLEASPTDNIKSQQSESKYEIQGLNIRGSRSDISGAYKFENNTDDFSREGYDYIAENDFHPVLETPLSTFSIDVDRASYANVRRFITQGSMPPVDAVRIEEMINYFSYDYAQPHDEHPFAIHTAVIPCPWNKEHQLALIGLQGKKIEIEKLPPANLVFLIDVSGSMMNENKLPLLKKSLELLVNELRPSDKVALVVYAGNAGLVLSSTPGNEKEKIMAAINNLEAGGSTAGGAGINLAYEVARKNFITGGNNRVILATDGDFNVGVSSDGELVRLIEEKRKAGVYLTVLGFGTGNYQDAKMEKLADKGNGNYAYIDNIMEAQKTLVSEMGGTLLTIAKDVKLQVEFNPAQVKEYKLIGYENRLLHDRDFNDDTKDAGELGSGHTVTALYEIIPADGSSSGVSVDPLKYQLKNLNQNQSLDKDLFTVKFRYKKPDEDKSKLLAHVVTNQMKNLEQASENIHFAAAVAAFGMLLRNSKYKGSADYKMVLQLAKGSRGKDEKGYRSEFIRMVETAQILDKNTADQSK